MGLLFSLPSCNNDDDNPITPLINLYDIDESTISFQIVAQADDPTYGNLFRILEPDTFNRYYLSFGETQNVTKASSSNFFVNLRMDSDRVYDS